MRLFKILMLLVLLLSGCSHGNSQWIWDQGMNKWVRIKEAPAQTESGTRTKEDSSLQPVAATAPVEVVKTEKAEVAATPIATPATTPANAEPHRPPPRSTSVMAEKKSKLEMRVEVINCCDQSLLEEQIAKDLLLKGFKIVNMGKSPTTQNAKLTDIALKKQYQNEAREIAEILPDKQTFSYLQDSDTVEISIRVGCDQLIKGVVTPESKPTATAKKKTLAELRIELLNGCQVPGLGERVAKKLLLAGLNVVAIGNAAKFDYKSTEIYYQKEFFDQTQGLASFFKLPLALIPDNADDKAEITVIIGCNER